MKYEILGDNLPVLSITMNRGDTVCYQESNFLEVNIKL